MVVVAVALIATGTASAAPSTRITIAVLPPGTTPTELARVHGMAIGLLSAGIGNVPATQTFVDIGQGARASSSLYDDPLPPLPVVAAAGGRPSRLAPRPWAQVRERAADAPADLVPGLLGTTLERAGASAHAGPGSGGAAASIADAGGRVAYEPGCHSHSCPGVRVVGADLEKVASVARNLRGHDLLIAFERPPALPNRELALGVAGAGLGGTLTSDSTRMRGYVLSTDIAPTILERLGIAVPHQMTGERMRANGAVDPAFVRQLEDRLAVIGPRRGPVIGASILVWFGLVALAGIAFGRRGLRASLPVLAVTLAYLPTLLLVAAALEPSELAERLIAGVGSPVLALVTLRLVSAFGALAIAGAVSVAGYAIDVIAGSHLTELSLIGPNPAGGIRFYGIGNELEATVAALVPIATGAGLVAWTRRAAPRRAALVFAITGLAAVAAFAPGRFGADVGAAIDIPIGVAVAIGACLGMGRGRLALVIAVPLVAVAALVAVDLLLGGNAHLTRTVLRAGGFDQLGQVAERRLRLSADSFSRYASTPMLWLAAAAIVLGILQRRRIEDWFGHRPLAWAGFVGAVAATAVGTLVNDSGALLLMIGAALAAATAGLAWATRARGLPSPDERRSVR